MSLCFRTLPGRLSLLVSGRKLLSKLDCHQVERHVESSAFLEQFLGIQKVLSIRTNVIEKGSLRSVAYILHQNVSLVSINSCNLWNEKSIGRYNEKIRNTIYWIQMRRPHRSQKLNIVIIRSRKHVDAIGMTLNNVTAFQTQNVIQNDMSNSFLDNSKKVVSAMESSRNNRELNRDLLLMDNVGTLKTSQQRSSPLRPQDNEGKPSQEQLQSVFDCLTQDLPKLFVKPLSYQIYTTDLIFINNIRGVTTKGLMNYVKQIGLLKVIGHIKFAHVKFDIIKITMHIEEATVKVRWRIRGVTGMRMIRMFWRYKIWKIQEAIDREHEVWYDGFSTFYVNGEGKVYKHIADKVMPDQDVAEKKENLRIAPKLALFTDLTCLFNRDRRTDSILKLHRLK